MLSNAVAIEELVEDDRIDSQIVVQDNLGFKGVFAKDDIVQDSVIFQLKGTLTTRPSKYTIQLTRNKHLNFPKVRKVDDDLDYCWQFLNHSCEPNGYMNIGDLTFRATRSIQRGEEITFNYLTTESAMAVPFKCICGSANCFGLIQGYDFLTDDQVKKLVDPAVPNNVVRLFTPSILSSKQSGQLIP
jgi:hypothetical protein